MKRILRIERQTGYLRAHLIPRDDARLGAIAVETQAAQLGGREVDGVPFEDYGGLGDVATAQDGWGGGLGAEGRVDFVLQRGEFLVGDGFGLVIAGDVDVDDAAAVDVRGQEDGGEFDLWVVAVS